MLRSWQYDQVRGNDDKTTGISPGWDEERVDEHSPGTRVGCGWLMLVAAQGSVIVFLLLYILLATWGEAECDARLSPYSPYLELGTPEYRTFTEANHLMQPSPYRGQPNPELEEAWVRLWRVPRIQFAAKHMAALNKSEVELYAHAPPERGGGVIGFLNVFHELHCLNLIRQYTYRDSYNYSDVTTFRASQELVRGHVDHCIETLRKQLMCTPDVTPLVFLKDQSTPGGMKSDFNIQRKCRDFSKIQQWTVDNAI